MSLVDDMRSLREDIDSEKETRSRRLKEIREDLGAFMKGATQKREEEFKVLAKELKSFIASLEKETEASLRESRREQQEIKKELAQASAAYWGKRKPKEE